MSQVSTISACNSLRTVAITVGCHLRTAIFTIGSTMVRMWNSVTSTFAASLKIVNIAIGIIGLIRSWVFLGFSVANYIASKDIISKDNELVPVPPIYSITIAAQVICMMANLLLVYGAWKDRNVFHALWLITTCIATIIRALYVIHNVKYNQFDQSLASVTVIAFTAIDCVCCGFVVNHYKQLAKK